MDAVFLSLATALATGLGEKAAGAAWASLVRLVRRRTAHDTGVGRALESAQATPEDDRIRSLAQELRRVAESDADLMKEIHDGWQAANLEMSAGQTHNEINGVVLGSAVQAGVLKIDGDLHFGRH